MRAEPSFRFEYAAVACIAAVLFILLIFLPMGQNVHVLGDELTYSFDSQYRSNEASTYPIWVYLNFFSIVNFAGKDFYNAARILNALIFVASVPLIYATAKRFANGKWPLIVAALATFSPISSYTTFFMPDAAYFTAFWLLTWFLLTRFNLAPSIYGAGTGALCGFATLVKPHGMFVLVALVMTLAILSVLKWKSGGLQRGIRTIGCLLIAFLLVRFGIGYLFAGSKAFDVVGAYSQFTSNEWTTEKLHAAVALGATLILAHSMALAIWIGPGVTALVDTHRWRSDSNYLLLAVYSTILTALMLAICISFSVRIADGAPVIDGYRMHMRYYNFLFPLFLIAAAAQIAPYSIPFGRLKLLVGFLLAALAAAGAVTPFLASMAVTHLDAPEIRGLIASGPAWLGVIGLLAAVACLASGVSPRWGGILFLALVLPLATLVSTVNLQRDLHARTTDRTVDSAAKATLALLGADVNKMSIAGDVWSVLAGRFTVNRPGPGDIEFQRGAQSENIRAEDVPSTADWLLVIGDHRYPNEWQRVASKPLEWTLLRRGNDQPYSGQTFNLTDSNWTRGVSNTGPIFFTDNTPEARENIREGRFVTFADGQTRRVTGVGITGPYLNVMVSGEVLPSSVGFPAQFAVRRWP